jgi:hypothetical protein
MIRLFILLSFLSANISHALDIDDCLTDAESYGSHNHPITLSPSCYDILKQEASHVQSVSSDNVWKAYSFRHLLFLEKFSGETLISREILAGDQTQLKEITSVTFDILHNKLLLLQNGDDGKEYLSFNLDFIGNVAPKTFLDHSITNGATSVSLSSDGKEVHLHTFGGIKVYSSSADTRYNTQADIYKVQLLRTEAF